MGWPHASLSRYVAAKFGFLPTAFLGCARAVSAVRIDGQMQLAPVAIAMLSRCRPPAPYTFSAVLSMTACTGPFAQARSRAGCVSAVRCDSVACFSSPCSLIAVGCARSASQSGG